MCEVRQSTCGAERLDAGDQTPLVGGNLPHVSREPDPGLGGNEERLQLLLQFREGSFGAIQAR